MKNLKSYLLSEKADQHLFILQMLMAIMFSYFQVKHMLLKGTEGISISLFAVVIVFIGANILLAWQSQKLQASIRMKRVIQVYSMWLIVHIILLVETIGLRIYEHRPLIYDLDMSTFLLVGIGYTATIIWAIIKKISYKDPRIKGIIGLISKSIPQILLMTIIFVNGGSGHSAVAIFLPMITPLMRIIQISLNPNHDKSRKWLLISEWGNELTWIMVALAWTTTKMCWFSTHLLNFIKSYTSQINMLWN